MRKRLAHATQPSKKLKDPSEAVRRKDAALALGMSLGTAINRLRRMVLFDTVRRLGEDSCFRCGEQIKSVLEFSIDHKEPWSGVELKRNAALFWDLTNIAFSHLRCNALAHQKIAPAGMAWCTHHKKSLPKFMFSKNASRWSGVTNICKECRSTARRAVYVPHAERGIEERTRTKEKRHEDYLRYRDRKRAKAAA